ncbi:MAG: hypothetical protein R3Y51_05540 [Rikenellaceae bacterium]
MDSNIKKKILYVDMDGVLVDFKSAQDALDEAVRKEYEGRLDDVPHLFSKMLPMPNALDSYRYLATKFDTYILSTSPWNNPTASDDKKAWVKRYLGDVAYKRLILTHHKNLNKGDYLIDDRTLKGVSEFDGEHIHFGTERFPDWASVVEYLEDKA